MPHIDLPEGKPGLIGLTKRYPGTGSHLFALAQALLRGPSPLTPAQREMIATHVSEGNRCIFCVESHSAAARYLLGEDEAYVVGLIRDVGERAPVGAKMQALLAIAGKVRESGRAVTEADIARARAAGADDTAIHDTVLIAAAFCMYNRYVDGLDTTAPPDPASYVDMGTDLGKHGYRAR